LYRVWKEKERRGIYPSLSLNSIFSSYRTLFTHLACCQGDVVCRHGLLADGIAGHIEFGLRQAATVGFPSSILDYIAAVYRVSITIAL
jgi:hypothetical protein